jgi:lactoylglutathione lyase
MKLAQKSMKTMTEVHLNLVVIRSIDLEKAVNFYQIIGLHFKKHRHGKGLEHFACELGQITFEIYPQTDQADITTGTRLGFQVSDLASLVIRLQKEDITVITKPTASEWGKRSVVIDPDGHRVELIQV